MPPLPMPALGVATQEFEPQRFDAMAPERGGFLGGVTLGIPLWRAKWTLSANLTREASDEWRAFVTRLRGAQRTFLAWDRDRPFPKAHRDGFAAMTRANGQPFNGSAGNWSQAIDDDAEARLTLTGLPAGLRLGVGDYVGFRWGAAGSAPGTADRRALVRVQAPNIASAEGSATLLIEPAVPLRVVPAGAVAHLDKPCCMMRLVTGETSLAALDRRQKIGGGTIVAGQDLRP